MRACRKNYTVLDMTDNEVAKLHVRHMVGGRSPEGIDELLYRFEFRERLGALLQFFVTGLRAALEHQPIPLSQSWFGLGAGISRLCGVEKRSGGLE